LARRAGVRARARVRARGGHREGADPRTGRRGHDLRAERAAARHADHGQRRRGLGRARGFARRRVLGAGLSRRRPQHAPVPVLVHLGPIASRDGGRARRLQADRGLPPCARSARASRDCQRCLRGRRARGARGLGREEPRVDRRGDHDGASRVGRARLAMDRRRVVDHQARRQRALLRAGRRHRAHLAAAALHDPVDEGRVRPARGLRALPRPRPPAEPVGADRREQPPLHGSPRRARRRLPQRARLDRAAARGDAMSLRDTLRRRTEQASTWLVARAGRAWGLLVIAVVLALTWQALRGIHVHEVRVLLRSLDGRWLVAAGGITLANVAIMGLYDVIAFSRTRTTAAERWRFGAVAFCWSNFLTLGPLAGPAIRLWLYRGTVDGASELRSSIVSVVIAFSAGLIGWTLAAVATAQIGGGLVVLSLAALVCVSAAAWIARAIARRFEDLSDAAARPVRTLELALVGWLDWLLAMAAFAACLRAAGVDIAALRVAHDFFVGQAIGLASLIPGGFGSSDALWIARLPIDRNVTVAALAAYRFIYYIGPWFTASLVLLSWATRQSSRRTELARRVVAALVGAAGVLIIVSSASPAIHARLILMERYVPLPLVEAGQIASALA